MKRFHIFFAVVYAAIVGFILWVLYDTNEFRNVSILEIAIFVGIVLSLFSHIKLFFNHAKIKGEMVFLWFTFINMLVPAFGVFYLRSLHCEGFDLTCVVYGDILLNTTVFLWISTIIIGLVTALRKRDTIYP
ncbi:MAG: hypothetical protein V4438_02365 [Patescibacteria group bacterium]